MIDIKTLSREEKARLLRELLAEAEELSYGYPRAPSQTANLARAEDWLWRRAENSRDPKLKNARVRVWFIFMLLRYGGLRVKEIFALGGDEINFGDGVISVGGEYGREAPLPPEANRKLAGVWREWPEAQTNPKPFVCDASQIRRVFTRCSRALDLPPGLLNARSMRRNRGREMENLGARPDLVDIFLGRAGGVSVNRELASALLRKFIQRGTSVKTSARNVFRCVAAKVTAEGILVDALLETSEGLKVAAEITQTSRESLKLEPGARALALVKAPWVNVAPAEAGAVSGINSFVGEVTEIRGDENAREILISLPEGQRLCSVYAGKKLPAPAVKKGDKVIASFADTAVILVEDA